VYINCDFLVCVKMLVRAWCGQVAKGSDDGCNCVLEMSYNYILNDSLKHKKMYYFISLGGAADEKVWPNRRCASLSDGDGECDRQ